MKIVLASVVALAIGVSAGYFAGKRQAASAPRPSGSASETEPDKAGGDDLEAVRGQLGKAESRATKAEADLAAAREKIASLEKKPAEAGKAKKKPQTPEEIAARVKEIGDEAKDAVEKKDGKRLIKLMKEAASLGEAGYMTAIEISGVLSQDVESGKLELGIKKFEFYQSFGEEMIPVMVWGLEKGDEIPEGFRIGSAYSLPWQTSVDGSKILLDALLKEKNPAVAQALAANLAGVLKPDMADELATAARASADNPALLGSIMGTLSEIQTPETLVLLESMAGDANANLRAEAELALIAYRPPAPGVLITYAAPNSQAEVAGIKRGDIITSYNGTSISTMDQLREEIGKTSGETLVAVTVNRKGELVTLQIRGQKIGINGKSVAPK